MLSVPRFMMMPSNLPTSESLEISENGTDCSVKPRRFCMYPAMPERIFRGRSVAMAVSEMNAIFLWFRAGAGEAFFMT